MHLCTLSSTRNANLLKIGHLRETWVNYCGDVPEDPNPQSTSDRTVGAILVRWRIPCLSTHLKVDGPRGALWVDWLTISLLPYRDFTFLT